MLGETLLDAHDAFAPVEASLTVGPAVAQLAPRERRILRLRFVDNLTQAQIGRVVGLSQMQVSRLLTDILARPRTLIVNPRAAGRPSRVIGRRCVRPLPWPRHNHTRPRHTCS